MTSKDSENRDQLYSVLALDRFIEATRDSGYKGTASAVSELVDNSIQAGAKKIAIRVERLDVNSGITISVCDNGCGMDPFTLRQALQFGGSTRFNDRKGIGRYGMGLPNSSLSQARHVKVYSWQHGSERKSIAPKVYATYLDLEEIISGVANKIPTPKPEKKPPTLCTGKSGTLVVWTRCDRLDNRRETTIERKLLDQLGRRFRYFALKGIRITVNGAPITIVDPLFLHKQAIHHGAKQYGKELIYELAINPSDPSFGTAKIKVRFTELPVKRWRNLSNDDKRRRGISKGAGVSVLRAGREVDIGWFFMGNKRKENYDDWWRCEIEFQPCLDEAFGITHTKQQVNPSQHLIDILTPDLEKIARQLNSRVRSAHREAVGNVSTPGRSESVATSRERLLAPLPVQNDVSGKNKMQKLRRKKLVAKSNKTTSFEYRVVPTDAGSTVFFSYGLSKQMLVLALNYSHPFFREMNLLIETSTHKTTKEMKVLIELLLLSAVRSEATEKSQQARTVLEKYRNRWSDILATYINS